MSALAAPAPASLFEAAQLNREGDAAARTLWAAALAVYARDVRIAHNGGYCDGGEAHADLYGSRTILARLCEPLNIDPDAFTAGLMQMIEQRRRIPPIH